MNIRLIKTEKKIQTFLEKLTLTLLPKETPKDRIKKIASYCHTLLKSTFPPLRTPLNGSLPTSNRTSLISTKIGTEIGSLPPSLDIMKKLTKIYKNKKKRRKDEIFERVNTLFYNLSKSRVLKKKAAVLNMLSLLSKDRKEVEQDYSKSRLLVILEKKMKERKDQGGMEIEDDFRKGRNVRIFQKEVEGENFFSEKKMKEEIENSDKEVKENLILGLIQLLKTGKSDYFKEEKSGKFSLKIKLKIKPQILNLILRIAEESKNVIFLKKYLDEILTSSSEKISLTKRSFISPLKQILENFDDFLKKIENSKQKETSIFGDLDKAVNSKFISVITFFTIMQEPLLKMQNTAIIIDSAMYLNNAHILSSLHTYANCGNHRLRLVAKTFIKESIKPLINFLLKWLNQGEIFDEFGEFFIRDNLKKVKFWENDCEIVIKNIPKIIGQEMAKVIFDIGSIVRFVRRMDLKFTQEDMVKEEGGMEVEYGEVGIDKIHEIDLNFECIPAEDMKGFLYEHYLKHAKMLKRCYLRQSHFLENFEFLHKTFFMRNGDFFDSLLHELDPILVKNASEVYFHEVMPLFRLISEKSSISNIGLIRGKGMTKLGAELLDRFGLKFLEKNDGDRGWDVFCLEFKFSDLMKHIVTDKIELKLQRFSHFLIKLRRLYYKMNQIWILQKKVLKSDDILISAYNLIVKCNLMRTHMSQFITNINSYVFYEVIASEYQKFISGIEKCEDLNQVRTSCDSLMDHLLRRCFLQKSENFEKGMKLKRKRDMVEESYPRQTVKVGGVCNSIQESIVNLLDKVENFSNSFMKIHSVLYDGNGRMNRYFPIKPSTKLISKVWEEYDNEYYHFLNLIESSCSDYGLEASAFKFDFNYFHVNKYEKKIGNRYFRRLANQKKMNLEQEEMSGGEDGYYFEDI